MTHAELRAVLDEIINLTCSYERTGGGNAANLLWEIEKLSRAAAARFVEEGLLPDTAAARSEEQQAGSSVAGCNDSTTGGAGD